jgi:hypothetical protein
VRREDRRIVVHTHDGAQRVPECERPGLLGCVRRIGKIEGEQSGGVRGFERAGLLGGDGQIDVQAPRRRDEGRGAVRRGRQQQQQPVYFLDASK